MTTTEQLRTWLAGAQCWIRVPMPLIERIIADGRFKTQFDGARSIAALDINDPLAHCDRAQIEQAYYGYPLGLLAELRPVYGYLCCQSNGAATHGHPIILDEYGTVAIRLRDEIKGRTTFCIGDSVGRFGHVKPAPLLAPESSAFSLDEEIDFATLPALDAMIPFVEAQYHGGVTVGDIAEVVFHVERDMAWTRRLIALLETHGIPARAEIVEE